MPVSVSGKLVWNTDPLAVLNALGQGARNRIMRKAVRSGAKPVRQAVKAGAPKRTGSLGSSISVKIGTSRKSGVVYAVIGPRRDYSKEVSFNGKTIKARPANYVHLLLSGTRPHSLAKGAKLGKKDKKTGTVGESKLQDRGRQHPGAKGKNFMLAAFNATAREYQEIIARIVKDEFIKAMKKQRK